MKQRQKKRLIYRKQLTVRMRFLIKTVNKYTDVRMSDDEPYIRRFRLGIFPILIELKDGDI